MIFARSGDNLLATATLSLTSGTEVVQYELPNLHDQHWAVPFKIEETTLDLRIDHGSAVSLGWVILGNSNVNVAAKFQRHTADSWATPDVDLTFATPTQSIDGFFTSPHLNLTGVTAKRWSRLLITANSLPVVIGELVLAASRRSLPGAFYRPNAQRGRGWKTVVHETGHDVDLRYSVGSRRERLAGQIVVSGSEVAELEGLLESNRGSARAFWMSSPINEVDAWLVNVIEDEPSGPVLAPGAESVSVTVRQVSRGLSWVDPDA